MSHVQVPIELGDGLVLRSATSADVSAVSAFVAKMLADSDSELPLISASVADLFGQRTPHSTTTFADFTVVENTGTGEIVSSLCLIPQTWSYEGIPFSSTLIEFVGTHEDYRNRGLIRRQFEVVHQWCLDRGILVQGIAGIPWYYRQFGYEYALDYGVQRVARRELIPKLDGEEPVVLRKATVDDAPFIAALEEANRQRWLLTCVRDEQLWRYEIDGRDPGSSDYVHLMIVERHDGTPIGFVAYSLYPDDGPWIEAFELIDGVSWLEVVPTVLRQMVVVYDGQGITPPAAVVTELELGNDHPVYRAMPRVLTTPTKPYSLYLRVADVPAFLRKIAPVLEARLARSVAAGHTGELAMSFYRSGVRLVFDAGRIADINTERLDDDADVALIQAAFVQLLFGYRSLAEIDHQHADTRLGRNTAFVLMDALFPKRPSYLSALG